MKMNTKAAAIVFSFMVLIGSVSGCGRSNEPTSPPQQVQQTQTPPKNKVKSADEKKAEVQGIIDKLADASGGSLYDIHEAIEGMDRHNITKVVIAMRAFNKDANVALGAISSIEAPDFFDEDDKKNFNTVKSNFTKFYGNASVLKNYAEDIDANLDMGNKRKALDELDLLGDTLKESNEYLKNVAPALDALRNKYGIQK